MKPAFYPLLLVPALSAVTATSRPAIADKLEAALIPTDAVYVCVAGSGTDRTIRPIELQEKVRLDIGVSDPFVDVTIQAILGSARTGDVGDGKVFVLDVNQVHRIRTGERDEQAVTPAEAVET